MKINPIGIDSYRNTMGNQAIDNKQINAEKKQVENDPKIKIPPQLDKTSSELAVKLKSGAFSDLLSAEEKEALELLFARYQNGETGSVYKRDGETSKEHLGNFVDVRL
jgi:hypothetical protein